jgi:hypothetical protein
MPAAFAKQCINLKIVPTHFGSFVMPVRITTTRPPTQKSVNKRGTWSWKLSMLGRSYCFSISASACHRFPPMDFAIRNPFWNNGTGIQKPGASLLRFFYLGPPENYPDDKKPDGEKRIFIRELWSSPIVFRRACKVKLVLCEDANAFSAEARRRVRANKEKQFAGVAEGDRILVLGEDEDGKTDDLGPVLVKVDQSFSRINWLQNQLFTGRLLAPLEQSDDEETEEALAKNRSSVILNMSLGSDAARLAMGRFLSGGDAEVAIWERLWQKHRLNPSVLRYHMLQTPHHCSWHSLSYDSWSELGEKAQVCEDARSALAQIGTGGKIVASSCAIHDDDNDPPCIRAKREYENIAERSKGAIYCTGEYPRPDAVAPLEFIVTANGFELLGIKESLLRPAAAAAAGFTFPNKAVVPNKPAGFA